jgi:hypothetical protein
MATPAEALARRVADAALAWLRDPRDTHAYERLVTAAEEYGRWRDPMLELDVTDAAAELAVLARATQVADLLGGDLHEVVARLRKQLVDEPRRRQDGAPNG